MTDNLKPIDITKFTITESGNVVKAKKTTDEELAKKWVIDNTGFNPKEPLGKIAIRTFLAGLKAGRPKWHDLQKNPNDLPLNADPVLCLGSTGFIVCKYISESWIDNQTIKLVPKYIDIYKWCEIEDTEE